MSVKLKLFYVFQTRRNTTVVMNAKSECLFSDVLIGARKKKKLWRGAHDENNRYFNVPYY